MPTSFKDKIAEVYKREFVDKTQPHLDKIFSLFKGKPLTWSANEEGGHSENRRKYFEKNRINDIVNIISRSFRYINEGRKLRILDLGTGFGEFSAVFRGFGHDVISINGGDTWYLDDFRYVCTELLGLNYSERDLLDLPRYGKVDYIFTSEVLTLDSLINKTDFILDLLYAIAYKVIIILHKNSVLTYNSEIYQPEIHCAVANHINIITFFSNDDYCCLAKKLVCSGKKFGYDIYAVPIIDYKHWAKSVCDKPRIIQKYYNKLGSPLLYLDADCEIVKPLHELVQIIKQNDICVRERNLKDRYNLGVMGFGTNQKLLRQFLHQWTNATKASLGNSQTVDQKPFSDLVHKKYRQLKVHNLGPYYNFLPADHLDFEKEKAYILHHKESKTNPLARAWRNQYYKQG
jgi:hypothetical protein